MIEILSISVAILAVALVGLVIYIFKLNKQKQFIDQSSSYYSDFSTKDVLNVYPNQRSLRTSAVGDPDVDSGATIAGIGENILGEGDHIPQLPVEIAKKFVKNMIWQNISSK